MSDLPSEILKWVASGSLMGLAAVATWGFLLWMGKREDRKAKQKEKHEVLDDVLESQRVSYLHATKTLHECEMDREKLRDMLNDKTILAYQYRVLVENFLIDFPHHTEWWSSRLHKIRDEEH